MGRKAKESKCFGLSSGSYEMLHVDQVAVWQSVDIKKAVTLVLKEQRKGTERSKRLRSSSRAEGQTATPSS